MKKIDWYILKKLFVTFIFCMLLFTVIAVAIDSSEKTDDFVKANLSTVDIFRKYYIGFIPWIWSMLFPLFVFIAVIFFTSKMAARSEVIAILASGTSYNRFLLPYFMGGVVLAMVLWTGGRYWIPKANAIRSNFQQTYVDKYDPTKNRNLTNCYNCFYRRIDSNTFIGLRQFDTASKSASGFFMEKVKNNKVYYNLRAEYIKWDTATHKWQLTMAAERSVDSMKETLKLYPSMTISISLRPEELRKDDYLKDKLTTPQLVAFIEQEEMRGTEGLNSLKVERYRRTAIAYSIVMLTLIGAIVASRKTRGGSGLHLALGIVIAAIFFVSDRFSTTFAVKGDLPPFLAAWLPNIFFTAIAVWIYRRTPK
jgi:lipopolysaccharide export system permease protein